MNTEIQLQLIDYIKNNLDLDESDLIDFDENTPLFEDGLGLDSLDMVDISIFIKKTFDVQLTEEDAEHLETVASIARFIDSKVNSN